LSLGGTLLLRRLHRTGDCWDNAPMESFWGKLKRELVHHERFTTKDEAKLKIFEYIEIFLKPSATSLQPGLGQPGRVRTTDPKTNEVS
jgi:putative transposase